MEEVQDKPAINPNSIKILQKSASNRLPLYSSERYEKDMEYLRIKL